MALKKIKKAVRILATGGPAALKTKLKNSYRKKHQYEYWIELHETDQDVTEELAYQPLISVVVPVYNVKSRLLRECIDSVLAQTYTNWELILVDDCSSMRSVRPTLRRYEGRKGVRIIYRKENGHISRATNTGFDAASGEFIGLMDCDDLLAKNALYEVAKLLNQQRDLDYIYSDEDHISEDDRKRMDAFFKPDWSPDTFMSLMYTCHFSVYRRSVINEVGGLRVGYEGSQDYDLLLRVMEKTDRIGHVPKILYHWRERRESTAKQLSAKPYVLQSTVRAKENALSRRGLTGHLEWSEPTKQYRVVYEPQNNPKVSIVIPSKDNHDVLKRCVEGIQNITAYPNREIIVVDNGSTPGNKTKIAEMLRKQNVTYLYRPMDFNFSAMCNIGAKETDGDYILFLNDDIEIQGEEWLSRMLGHCQLAHVGAVGCKLYYPGGEQLQHCGVLNLPIGPGHAFHRFEDKDMIFYYGRNLLEYNFSIVTGACLMVSRAKFDEVGGFDETLPVAYNDVELCFKLIDHGYFNVLRTDVAMIHHESVSRGYEESPEKIERQQREMAHLYELHPKWKGVDPCYNPNLTKDRGDFSFDIPMLD